MFTNRVFRAGTLLAGCCIVSAGVFAQNAAETSGQAAGETAAAVGWREEFDRGVGVGWVPWTAFGGSDVMAPVRDALRVRLGATSLFLPAFGHYRAGVWRDTEVDLRRYPILAVRASRFRGAATWDAQVLQYRDPAAPDARDVSRRGGGAGIPVPGNPEGLVADEVANTGNRNIAETAFVYVRADPARTGKSRVRLLLNLSGPERGAAAAVDFDWVRFLTPAEAEAERLRQQRPRPASRLRSSTEGSRGKRR